MIADYDELFEPLRARRIRGSGHQPGDPGKAAAAVLRFVAAEQPPARLLLGTDTLPLVKTARDAIERDMPAWAEVPDPTDFDDVSSPS